MVISWQNVRFACTIAYKSQNQDLPLSLSHTCKGIILFSPVKILIIIGYKNKNIVFINLHYIIIWKHTLSVSGLIIWKKP